MSCQHALLALLMVCWCFKRCDSNSVPATKWSVANAGPTAGPWWVNEVKFYSDQACTLEVRQSGTPFPGRRALLAFDGFAVGTPHTFKSYCTGCSPGEASIGLEFPTAVTVECARILQSGANMVALIGADGEETLISHAYESLYGGAWATLRIPDRRRIFKLTVTESTSASWIVQSVGMYSDDTCTQELSKAHAAIPSTARVAFDANDLTNYTVCDGCLAFEDFLGQVFDDPLDVGCIKITTTGVAALALTMWDAMSGAQETLRTWTVVPGRPNVLSMSKYHVTFAIFNAGDMSNQIQAEDIKFFADENCTDAVSETGLVTPKTHAGAHDSCPGCATENWMRIGWGFANLSLVQCLQLSVDNSSSFSLKRLVEPNRSWQRIGTWTVPAKTIMSIPVSATTVTSVDVFEPTPSVHNLPRSSDSSGGALEPDAITSKITLANTSNTTAFCSCPACPSMAPVTVPPIASGMDHGSRASKPAFRSTMTTTQQPVVVRWQQNSETSTASGYTSATEVVAAGQSSEQVSTSRTRLTSTTSIIMHSVNTALLASSTGDGHTRNFACKDSGGAGVPYWICLTLVSLVACVSTSCTVRLSLSASKAYRVHADGSPTELSKNQSNSELELLKIKLEVTEQERDIAKWKLGEAEQQRDNATQQALHFQQEAQTSSEQLCRFRRDSTTHSLKSICDEIDGKVQLLKDSSDDQSRTKLKKMKAQYHPDYQRVKNNPELLKVFVQLSQHINRFCDAHLARDCPICSASKPPEIW